MREQNLEVKVQACRCEISPHHWITTQNLDERARTQRDIEALLHDLYILMSKTNIISVVAIGLMVSF